MKKNSDEKEQTLKSEYEAMMVIKQSKQEHFDQKINETYKSICQWITFFSTFVGIFS